MFFFLKNHIKVVLVESEFWAHHIKVALAESELSVRCTPWR